MPKRVVVFIDGQNLYHGARNSWAPDPPAPGPDAIYATPCYDVRKIALHLTARLPDRVLAQCRFYTGVPSRSRNAHWHGFWTNKLRAVRNQKVHVYTGRINPGGQEKGVDVSIAIDLIDLTYRNEYDVAVLVSSDQDLSPAIALAKLIARDAGRSPEFESASPYERGRYENRGLQGATWIQIDKAAYDRCRDFNEYRPWQSRP